MDSLERIGNVLLVKRLMDGAPVDGRDLTSADLEKIASGASEQDVLAAKMAAFDLLGRTAAHAYMDEMQKLSAVLES